MWTDTVWPALLGGKTGQWGVRRPYVAGAAPRRVSDHCEALLEFIELAEGRNAKVIWQDLVARLYWPVNHLMITKVNG